MVQSTLVYQGVSAPALDSLSMHGFTEALRKSEYELRRFKKEKTTIVLYSSGKLVVSAPENELSSVEKLLSTTLKFRLKSSKTTSKRTIDSEQRALSSIPDVECIIGSDETLKGDTFGGLVVCACRLCKSDEDVFRELGVKDSKQLSADEIDRIASSLLKYHDDKFSIVELSPKEYNEQSSRLPTTTKLLDKLHSQVTAALKKSSSENTVIVVDKYPGCRVGDVILEHAESKSLAVAAASIVARYKGVKQVRVLSDKLGFRLPFGSTHVKDALVMLKNRGVDPELFCKMHFSNVKKIVNN
ncbi:MAG: hypothetical protein ACQESE_01415 [Nanobdellota archaeon]